MEYKDFKIGKAKNLFKNKRQNLLTQYQKKIKKKQKNTAVLTLNTVNTSIFIIPSLITYPKTFC